MGVVVAAGCFVQGCTDLRGIRVKFEKIVCGSGNWDTSDFEKWKTLAVCTLLKKYCIIIGGRGILLTSIKVYDL